VGGWVGGAEEKEEEEEEEECFNHYKNDQRATHIPRRVSPART